MQQRNGKGDPRQSSKRIETAACERAPDGTMVELVLDEKGRTQLLVGNADAWSVVAEAAIGRRTLRPYPESNSLIRHRVILLPGEPLEYGSEAELADVIKTYIHRYVSLSADFEEIAAAYVMLSWVYDAFNELPYLRIRGDYGSGKTRFLHIVGSICRTPIFSSGASTVSPIFYALDAFRGTLILDEADFRMSDERADLVKILNNGNARGFPVLRQEVTPQKEFSPRAFSVFGPKLVATRGIYADRALESRFLTELAGAGPLRADIPLNLPEAHADEAREMRSKLLLYRLRTLDRHRIDESLHDARIEPRLNQVMGPLLAVAPTEEARTAIREAARAMQSDIASDRGLDRAADLLGVIKALEATKSSGNIPLRIIAAEYSRLHLGDSDRPVSARTVGMMLRKDLLLRPRKSHGIYVLPDSERPRLLRLYDKYGVSGTSEDLSDVRVEPIAPSQSNATADDEPPRTIDF